MQSAAVRTGQEDGKWRPCKSRCAAAAKNEATDSQLSWEKNQPSADQDQHSAAFLTPETESVQSIIVETGQEDG
jgi:hypothetical protein